MSPNDAFAHCEALVREHVHDRFLAGLFAPAESRPLLHALYAFDWEIGQVAARVREPLAGEVRLQWWRDVLEGSRAEEARANPVAAALLTLLATQPAAAARLLRLLDARAGDLYPEMMRSVADFEHYADETAGAIFTIAVDLLGAEAVEAHEAEEACRHAGIALRLTQAIRDVGLDASRGHLYIPADLLTEEGVAPADLLAGNATPELAHALQRAADLALLHAGKAQNFAAAERRVGAAFLELALVPVTLRAAIRRGEAILRAPRELSSWRRQWALWRAARRLR